MRSVKSSMSPCRECGHYVYTGESFDILPISIKGVITSRVVHRACNKNANHSKD